MIQNAFETHVTIFLNNVIYIRTKEKVSESNLKIDRGASVPATKTHMS